MSPQVDKPLISVMHGQCNARPTVTFPATQHHCPLTGNKLYSLVTEAHVCEQLAQGSHLKVQWPGVERMMFWGPIYKISYDYLTIMPKLRSTYDGRLIYKISYNEWKAFHRQDSRAKL